MILVAVRDVARREAIRSALASEGLLVSVVGSLESAFRMAADHAPQLVVLDGDLQGADQLVGLFSRQRGGPGTLVVGEAPESVRALADGLVAADVGAEELLTTVQSCLEAPRAAAVETPSGEEKRWTSQELFGEILEDLDEPPLAAPATEPDGEAGGPFLEAEEESAPPVEDEDGPPEADEAHGHDEQDEDVEEAAVEETPAEPTASSAEEDEPHPDEGAAEVAEAVHGEAEAAEVEEVQLEEVEEEASEEEDPVEEEVIESDPGEAEEPDAEVPDAEVEDAEPAFAAEDGVTAPSEPPEATAEADAFAAVREALSEAEQEVLEEEPAEVPTVEQAMLPERDFPAEVADAPEVAVSPQIDLAAELESSIQVVEGELDALAEALLGRDQARAVAEVEEAARESAEEERGTTSEEASVDEEPSVEGVEAAEAAEPEVDEPEIDEPEVVAVESDPGEEPTLELWGQLGGYRLLEPRPGTATYEAFVADQPASGRRLFLKRLTAAAADRPDVVATVFEAARAGAELSHPGVGKVYEASRVEGDIVIAQELIDGQPLSTVFELVSRLGVRMPLGLVLWIGEKIASALEAIHAADLVHGGLHPGNVMLTYDGEVKLVDVGISRALADAAGTARPERLRYRSPEQVAGDEPDARSDLFAFGTVLFELVTGRRAFESDDSAVVASAIVNEEPEAPERVDPTIPTEVGGLIGRMLKRRRDERIQGASESRRKLDLALQGLPSPPGGKELAAYLRQLEEAVDLFPEDPPEEDPESGAERAANSDPVQEATEPLPVASSDSSEAIGTPAPPEPTGPAPSVEFLDIDDDSEVEARGASFFWWWVGLLALLAVIGGVALAVWRGDTEPAATDVPVVTVPPPAKRPTSGGAFPLDADAVEPVPAPPSPPAARATAPAQPEVALESLVAEEFARRQAELERRLGESAEEGEEPADDSEPPTDEPPAGSADGAGDDAR